MTTTLDLREALGLGLASHPNPSQQRFTTYGVLENPFPPSSRNEGNPRFTTEVDLQLLAQIKRFLQTGRSEVVVVTGTQGLGKTNLLEFYQRHLPGLLEEKGSYLVVRYSDPEPDFGSVVRRIFHELGAEHLRKLALSTKNFSDAEVEESIKKLRTRELQVALRALFRFWNDESRLLELSKILLEFLMGSRLYKRHNDELGLMQRLDTTESKNQALRDLIFISKRLEVLSGVFLFIDELEKVGELTIQVTTRYLSAIRALIDALPDHLFLILAMTPDAYDRYARILPALGGRLQDRFELQPLRTLEEATQLSDFYLETARQEARTDPAFLSEDPGKTPLFSGSEMSKIWTIMAEDARRRGQEGVIQRAFLDRLHDRTNRLFESSI